MINLFSDKTNDYTGNGIATLTPISATFSVDINGAWSFNMSLPYDHEEKYKNVVQNAVLRIDLGCIREQAVRQLFRIFDVKKNLTSISVIAFPIGMEAIYDAPIEELVIPGESGVASASGADAAAVLNNYIKTHDDNDKYTVSSNVATQSRSQWENTNLIAAISGSDDNSFVNKWGGEVLYDNFAITIKNKFGNDIKFPVLYGRNLMGLEEDLDMSSVITRAFPISEDGLRLHDYDDVDIDYWYGTFEDGEPKNWAASQDLYSYEFGTWYRFDEHGKMLVDAIPAEDLAWLAQYEWHEDSTGWWYGCDSVHYIANGWVEDANGKHYWMDAQGYMDSSKTDTDVWTWNQYDDGNMHHGDKRLSYVDSEEVRKGTYPYIRSAFLNAPYGLLDTDSKSYSTTAIATRNWTTLLYNAIYDKAEELWNTALEDLTNIYCPEYLQEIIEDISKYTQARYAYSHKGWQSLIKSCISSGLSWIKDVDLDEEGWIEINGWMYGDFDSDGNFKNYPKNQYIYSYENSKWYWFDEAGIMSTDEIPAEDLAWLNNCDWRRDDVGQYYGDGQGHYIAYGWVENSNGTHSWVNAQGYYEAQYDDSDTWEWTEISGWKYGRSKTQYAVNEYVLIDKNLEWFGGDGFWRDWERVGDADMQWYQEKEGANAGKWWYGSKGRNYAHNEYVYVTESGQMKEWFYDSDGWYDEDKSGDSEKDWHGSGDSQWFGTVDSETGEADEYIHDRWAYIDGTYYWFNSEGYISGDASMAKQDWPWGDQTDSEGNHWFGNPDESFNRIYLQNQWFKIDGVWYYFDNNGYMVDTATKKSQTISWFSNAIVAVLTPLAKEYLKQAYDLLYNQMTVWVEKQYAEGLDVPSITVTVDLVDLSKTSEYADYADLEKIYLGDSVKCVDTVHGMSIDARVVGLTYDLIRGYNTKVTIGQLAKNLSQILSVSYNGSSKDTSVDNIIAGDGVKKDGNVISVSDTPGTSYGIQDVIYEGASLVSGNVAVLDEVGAKHREVWQSEFDDLPESKNSDGVIYFIRDGSINPHDYISSITATFGNEELTDTNDIYMTMTTSATGEVDE